MFRDLAEFRSNAWIDRTGFFQCLLRRKILRLLALLLVFADLPDRIERSLKVMLPSFCINSKAHEQSPGSMKKTSTLFRYQIPVTQVSWMPKAFPG